VLNISSFEQLEEEYVKMSTRLGNPCVITKMVSFESELIFGMKTDSTFGPLIVIGAGGIFTELIKDRFVILPTTSRDLIKEKLQALKTYKLLTGFRGSRPVDIEKLLDSVEKFQDIIASLSDYIKEVDINPVALTGEEVIALDALIIIE
jgi:acetyltransferase